MKHVEHREKKAKGDLADLALKLKAAKVDAKNMQQDDAMWVRYSYTHILHIPFLELELELIEVGNECV